MDKEMNLRMMFRGVEVDERTRDYVEKRIAKIAKVINGENENIYEVEIDKDKIGNFRVEIMVSTPYKRYRSEEVSESIEGSADVAVDELKNQISRDIGKIRELKKRGARSLKKKVVIDQNARF